DGPRILVLLRKCCSYRRTILSTKRYVNCFIASWALELTPRRPPRTRQPEQSGAFAVSLPVDLLKFALLFSTLYAAFGVASPFLPELLSLHGLNPERLGITLSFATTIRLVSAPLAGRIADGCHALRIVLWT